MAEAGDSARSSSGLDAAGQRIRETAKWLIVTFGAVAAVLVGGLQLTTLPELEGDDRKLALYGYGLGIGGAALAILAAAIVMTGGRRALHELEGTGGAFTLRKKLNELEDLRAGYGSISQLVAATNEAIVERTQAWEAWQRDPSGQQQRYEQAVERMKVLTPASDRLLHVASFEHLRRTWLICLLFIGAGAATSAVGVALFAANSATADDDPEAMSTPVVAPHPVPVRVRLTEDGMAMHGALLGSDCPTGRIDAIALGATRTLVEILVVPTSGAPCNPRRLVLRRREARVTARNRIQLPDLAAAPATP